MSTETPSPPHSGAVQRAGHRGAWALALGGMLALAAGLGIGRFAYTPILPAMAGALGLTKAEAGLVASANFLGYLLGAVVAAVPRLPGRRGAWVVGSLVATGGTMAAMAGVETVPAFLALRFAAGFAGAFTLVLASGVVLGGLAARGARGLSALHFGGVGVGIALTAAGVAALGAAGVGWRGQWVAAGLATLVAAIPVAFLLQDREDNPGAPATSSGAARVPPGFVVAYGLCGLGYSVTATFLVASVRVLPDPGALETWAWLAVGLAAMPSVWVWGTVGRRIGPAPAMALASVLQSGGVTAGAVWPGVPGATGAAVFLGGTFMGITAFGFMAAQALPSEARRRATAALTAAFGAGQVLGPVLGGVVGDLTGSFLAPTLLAASASLLATVVLLGSPRGAWRS